MTLTVDLPPEIENAFREEAEHRGVEPADIAVESMILYAVALDSLSQRPGRIYGIQHLPAQTGADKTSALLQWIAFLHDQGKPNRFSQLTISERLHAIQETTQAAEKIIPDIPYTRSWDREDIYEGDTERVLGILEKRV